MKDYDQLFQSALVEVDSSETSELLEKTRVKYFGKSGLFTLELKKISSLNPVEKKKPWKKTK